jgi:L-ascorbate metabolism protein UlaG (beta-lactamase superfamily)
MAAMPLVAWTAGALAPVLAQEAGGTLEGDTLSTAEGDVTIHPVSHASLVLGFGDEVIYVDPVGGAELYADLPAATAILITHGHGDHFDVPTLEAIAADIPIVTTQEVYDKLPEALQANATALQNGEDGEINGVPVLAVTAYNTTPDRLQYHPQGVGNGYVLTFGDKLVYVAGDTEPTPEMLALEDIAVAFLPMNLPYTMTPEQAAEAVNTFKPGIVYPYHHRGSDLDAFEAAVEDGIEVRRANWYPSGEGSA